MDRKLISVDRWSGGSQAYFLTHLHADHTIGLSAAWSWGPLFCSSLTAKLLPFKFPGFNLSLLRILDVGSWQSLALADPFSGDRTVVQVMPIDAHHCPGSVMFLFRGDFGWWLYTGDFRWEAVSERANKSKSLLLNTLKGRKIDVLYLDNTYCHPAYVFPSRTDAAKQVVDIIISHPEHDVIIAIDNLGKEDLLLYISRRLKIKIWVWPERLQTLHLLGYGGIFTTKTSLTRVRAVPRYSLTIDTLEGLNTLRPTIGIMPSGLPGILKPIGQSKNNGDNDRQKRNVRPVERLHPYIYSVPYSDHSSYPEVQEFVQLVQPISTRGIVSSSSRCIDPLYHFGDCQGVNEPSRRLWQKQKGVENVSAFRPKSSCQTKHYLNSGRKQQRSDIIRVLGSRISRVNALRQNRHGVKIGEDDD